MLATSVVSMVMLLDIELLRDTSAALVDLLDSPSKLSSKATIKLTEDS